MPAKTKPVRKAAPTRKPVKAKPAEPPVKGKPVRRAAGSGSPAASRITPQELRREGAVATLRVFLGNLHNLGWSTALDASTYLRASVYIFVLGALIGFTAAVLGGIFALALGGLGFVIGLSMSLPFLLWLFWQTLKLMANRVHHLGFRARYYFIYYIAFNGLNIILSRLQDKDEPLPMWIVSLSPLEWAALKALIATAAITYLMVQYYLFFAGPQREPVGHKVELFRPARLSWILKGFVALVIVLVLAVTAADLSFLMFQQ